MDLPLTVFTNTIPEWCCNMFRPDWHYRHGFASFDEVRQGTEAHMGQCNSDVGESRNRQISEPSYELALSTEAVSTELSKF